MDLRLAQTGDLPALKAMYKKIICRMEQDGIPIWDEVYPCAFFEEDIEKGRLYVLTQGREIAAAFALCETDGGEPALSWKDPRGRALYLGRLGVSVDHLRQGVGSAALRSAMALAQEKGAEFLRLLVVDIDLPAIDLYRKNGFCQADGVHVQRFDDVVLHEYGFEIGLLQPR